MKKVRKIILRTFLIVVLLICLGSWYLNNIFLPQKIRLWMTGLLRERIDRQITLGKIRYNIFKGIVLKDITIFGKEGEEKFLSVKEMYFKFPVLPLLRKRFIITNLSVISPVLSVTRLKDEEWNFSDVLKGGVPDPQTKFTLLISRAVIVDGQALFKDLTKKPPFEGEIADINGEMYLALLASMHFKFSSKIQQRTIALQSKGNYNFISKVLNVNFNIQNITLTDYAPYYRDILPFQLDQGQANLQLDLSLTKDKPIRLYGVYSIKNLALSEDALKGSGNIEITAILNYTPDGRKVLEYEGNVRFDNFQLEGLPLIENITGINGKVAIVENTISTKDLKLSSWGMPVVFNGEINNFRNPSLNLTASSEADLSKIKESIPARFKDKLEKINISGKALLSMKISGGIRRPALDGKLTISEARCKPPFLSEDLKNINGNFEFKSNSLSTSDLTLSYKDTGYKLILSLIDLNRPDKEPNIEFDLRSEDLSLLGELNIKENNSAYFSTTEGKYLNSSFALTGVISDWPSPQLDITGDIEMDLADLTRALAGGGRGKVLSKLNPKGRVKLTTEASGKWEDWQNWSAVLKGKSDQVTIKKVNFDRLFFDIKMENKKISLVKLTAEPYGGVLNSTGFIDLGAEQRYWRGNLQLINIDLSGLSGDSGLKWQNISGNLSGAAVLEGREKAETIIGKGWLEVGEGKFWKLPLFLELSNILYFPYLKKTLFNRGFATFAIANKTISTSDLSLQSEGLNLLAKGSIDFDGNLDFSISTELAKNLADKMPKLSKIASMIISGLWNYAVELRLEGTIEEPKYSIVSRMPKR